MTTVKEVSADLVHALGLHAGDLLAVMEERLGRAVIVITRSARDSTEPLREAERRAAFDRFSMGTTVEKLADDAELDDARLQHLMKKQLTSSAMPASTPDSNSFLKVDTPLSHLHPGGMGQE